MRRADGSGLTRPQFRFGVKRGTQCKATRFRNSGRVAQWREAARPGRRQITCGCWWSGAGASCAEAKQAIVLRRRPHDRKNNVNLHSRWCRHMRCAPVAPRQLVIPRAPSVSASALGQAPHEGGPHCPPVGDGWSANGHRRHSSFCLRRAVRRCGLSPRYPGVWHATRPAQQSPGRSERGWSNTSIQSAAGGCRRGPCVLSLGLSGHRPGRAFRSP
jgi:hypothetical protein